MTDQWKFGCAIAVFTICSIPLFGQVLPVPIPGGDIIPPTLYINQFLPGVGPGFDGMNADPHGITNFNGLVAMGYGVGTATDNTGRSYLAVTDVRVYQGEYFGGEPNGGAGRTRSKLAHGTFVEIWLDFYDLSSGSQLHDFNPGITANGVFWIVQVPDDAIQVSDDSLTLNLQNVAVVDQLQFPGGTGTTPASFTYTATYVKSGSSRLVMPKSRDPLSPFNWAGRMWTATNSGTFSVAYSDGSFSATGSFDSTGNFGEMGIERNGRFVGRGHASDGVDVSASMQEQSVAARGGSRPTNLALLKGRVPLSALTHSTAKP